MAPILAYESPNCWVLAVAPCTLSKKCASPTHPPSLSCLPPSLPLPLYLVSSRLLSAAAGELQPAAPQSGGPNLAVAELERALASPASRAKVASAAQVAVPAAVQVAAQVAVPEQCRWTPRAAAAAGVNRLNVAAPIKAERRIEQSANTVERRIASARIE